MSNDKLIEHLSKEIETLSNNLIAFRNRVALTILLGPILIPGAMIVATKGNFEITKGDSCLLWIAGILAFAFYGLLGLSAARIEKQGWIQCNKWRKTIVRLSAGEVEVKSHQRDIVYSSIEDRIIFGYLSMFFLITMSSVAMLFIASRVKGIVN